MTGVVSATLLDEISHRLRPHVKDHRIGRVAHLQASMDDQCLDKGLVHSHVGRNMVEDFAESDEFPQAWNFQAELMLHLQAQMTQIADDVFWGVDRDLMGAGHTHGWVIEHTHHIFDGIFVR